MTVENAHAFLDELLDKGHSPDLMSKIGTDFNSEHMTEALEARGTSKDELLKKVAGGASTTTWDASVPIIAAGTAAA
tara:strand:- start:125 stop:355 length:231 start_codon:yes stop_codon:yes gene_type:complete